MLMDMTILAFPIFGNATVFQSLVCHCFIEFSSLQLVSVVTNSREHSVIAQNWKEKKTEGTTMIVW
jgi:hypothetical protein